MKRVMAIAAVLAMASVPCAAQNRSEDDYTRYELLAPETASFKIVYDVTAVTPGAKFFFNPIRKGSEASDESVIDLMTGGPLKFHEVTGAEARECRPGSSGPRHATTSRSSSRGLFRKAAKGASGFSRHTRTPRATTVRAT